MVVFFFPPKYFKDSEIKAAPGQHVLESSPILFKIISLSHLLFKTDLVLSERQSDGGEGERNLATAGSLPGEAIGLGLKPGVKNSMQVSCIDSIIPGTWAICCCFLRCVSRVGNGAAETRSSD